MSSKLIYCTSTCNRGYCIDWLIASVYNIADQIVIWDSSPLGPSTDNTVEVLKDLVGEKNLCIIDHFSESIGDFLIDVPDGYRVYFIRDNWFDYDDRRDEKIKHTFLTYAEVTGIPRTKNLAGLVAYVLGCDWILWSDSDEIFYPNVSFLKTKIIPRFREDMNVWRYSKLEAFDDNFDKVLPITYENWSHPWCHSQYGLFKRMLSPRFTDAGGNIVDPGNVPTERMVQVLHVSIGGRGPGFPTAEELFLEKYKRHTKILFENYQKYGKGWEFWEGEDLPFRFEPGITTYGDLCVQLKEIAPTYVKKYNSQSSPFGIRRPEGRFVPKFKPLVMRMDPKEYIEKGYPLNIKNEEEYYPL